MIKIYRENVWLKFQDLPNAANKLLYDGLSYEDENTKTMKRMNKAAYQWDTRKRLFQRKRMKCLSGLIYRVCDILKSNYYEYKIIDCRKKPEKEHTFLLENDLHDPYKHQKQAIELIKERATNAFSITTSGGKTDIIMHAVKEWGVNTLIIVPTLNLKDQFIDDLKYHFGRDKVCDHKETKLKPIVVANIQGLQKLDKKFFNHFKALVIDEVHHSSSTSYYNLNKKFWDKMYYRLFVTATFFRNDGNDMKLEAMAGRESLKYQSRQAVEDGVIVRPKFMIYKVNHFCDAGDWMTTYEQNIVKNIHRNKIIIEKVNKLMSKTNKNILVLCNRIEHCDILHDNIKNSIIINGSKKKKENKKNIEKYKMNNIRCAIATSQVLSEGINIPNIEILVIAGGYASEILVCQSVGRCVRKCNEINKKFAIVIDILDKGSRILERHSKKRIKVYKDYFFKDDIKFS